MGMRAQPDRQLLRPGGFGKGIAGGAEHCDEHLCLADLAAAPLDHRHRLPGVIDEQLLADTVLLTHRHVQLALPGSVVIAEPAVLEALRLAQAVLSCQSSANTPGSRRDGAARYAPMSNQVVVATRWTLPVLVGTAADPAQHRTTCRAM